MESNAERYVCPECGMKNSDTNQMTFIHRLALATSPIFFVASIVSGTGDDANGWKFLVNLVFGWGNLFYGLGAFSQTNDLGNENQGGQG